MTRTELLVWFYRRQGPHHERKMKPVHIITLRSKFGMTPELDVALDALIELGALRKIKNTYEVTPKWQAGLGVSGQSRVLGVSKVRTYKTRESASLNGTREPVRIADGLWSSTARKNGRIASTAHT